MRWNDYFAMIESYDRTTAALRDMDVDARKKAGAALAVEAKRLLDVHVGDAFEKVMIWHADKHYRILNDVEMLDGASFVFLGAVGAAFDAVARARGVSIAYVVDNAMSEDRLHLVAAAFNALGFMVASTELFAMKLGVADGIAQDQVLATKFAFYRGEATMLARRLFDAALEGHRHCLWLSADADANDLSTLAKKLDHAPYVGVFRNDVPADGTSVHVFRSGGRSVALEFG